MSGGERVPWERMLSWLVSVPREESVGFVLGDGDHASRQMAQMKEEALAGGHMSEPPERIFWVVTPAGVLTGLEGGQSLGGGLRG